MERSIDEIIKELENHSDYIGVNIWRKTDIMACIYDDVDYNLDTKDYVFCGIKVCETDFNGYFLNMELEWSDYEPYIGNKQNLDYMFNLTPEMGLVSEYISFDIDRFIEDLFMPYMRDMKLDELLDTNYFNNEDYEPYLVPTPVDTRTPIRLDWNKRSAYMRDMILDELLEDYEPYLVPTPVDTRTIQQKINNYGKGKI